MKTLYDIDHCDLDAPTATVDVMLTTELKTLPPPPLPGATAPLAQLEAEVEAFKALGVFRAWLQDRSTERVWPAPEKKISNEN